ncbi:MAG: Maf family nucleotide pyrophosphatase [Burkholderiales bacterium]|nr:Maf family nucleotide pyrophosphatase [Burkholderiales bacterium]
MLRKKSSPSFYLASQSPRRQALLTQAGASFAVLPPINVQEMPRSGESAEDYVLRMAQTKATIGMRAARRYGMPMLPVLGADTEVILNKHIFGKPQNEDEVRSMLRALSGATHEVLTAIALCFLEKTRRKTASVVVASRVSFKNLSDDEITRYLASGEPFGKAGAYAIQERGGVFVTHIEGSYSAIVGLPLYETTQLLTTHAGIVI